MRLWIVVAVLALIQLVIGLAFAAGVLQASARLRESLASLRESISELQSAVEGASDFVRSLKDALSSSASMARSAADAADVDIFGFRPFSGLADNLRELADSLEDFSSRLPDLSISLNLTQMYAQLEEASGGVILAGYALSLFMVTSSLTHLAVAAALRRAGA